MRKITLFLSVLFMALVVKAQTEPTPVVKMTYVDYDNPDTPLGEIAFGSSSLSGYNKISNGSVGLGEKTWLANYITYLQVDASSYTDLIVKATLTIDVSGSLDNKRTTCWGIGYNSSVWSENLTFNTADKSITTIGETQWTSTKSASTFETKEFNIYDAIKNDEDKIVTLIIYETAAGGGNIKNPTVTIETGEMIPVTGISLDKSTAEITEGMVMNLLTATVIPDDATEKNVTWYSSNESIAKVSNGQVTGVAVGTAIITAESNGYTATCEVTVKEKVVKTSWNFANLLNTYGNKAALTYAVNTVKLNKIECNYGIGEYEGLAMQGAGSMYLYSGTGGLYNGNSGGRLIGVLNLKSGSIVTLVVSEVSNNSGVTAPPFELADASNAVETSVATVDGKTTYVYTMIADGTLSLTIGREYTLYSIDVQEARELVVTDGEDLNAEGTYTNATYERKFNTEYTYGTICLPFAPDAETCANYTFYKLMESNNTTLYFEEETEPKANVAYLYKLNEGVDAEEAKTFTGGVTTIAEVESEAVGGWQLIGSFKEEKITDLTDGKYFAYKPVYNEKKDVFVKATNSLTVKPYRAYFKFVETQSLNFAPAAAVMFLSIGGEYDGTNEIEKVVSPEEVEGAVFDMEGRPVEKMQEGKIYIVGGQKVIK